MSAGRVVFSAPATALSCGISAARVSPQSNMPLLTHTFQACRAAASTRSALLTNAASLAAVAKCPSAAWCSVKRLAAS
jgi:hypothetical protein